MDALLCVLEDRQPKSLASTNSNVIVIPSTATSGIAIQCEGLYEEIIKGKLLAWDPNHSVIAQPLVASGHWTLLSVCAATQSITHYNSLARLLDKDEDPSEIVGSSEELALSMTKFWRQRFGVEWKLNFERKKSQRQAKGTNDCGVFVAHWVRCLLGGTDPTLEEDVKYLHSVRGELALYLISDSRFRIP